MDLEASILASLDSRDEDPEPQRARDETDDYDIGGHKHDHGDRCDSDHEHDHGYHGDDGYDGGGGGDRHPHRGNSGPQTGVKGVLNEKRQFDRETRESQAREAREIMDKLRKAAITVARIPDIKDEEDEDDLDALLENDDFLQQYKDQRMKQMNAVAQSRPTYGTCQNIHVLEYVDTIDKSPKDVPVIVHLYQEHLRECKVMNKWLDLVAKKYVHARFVKIIATEADDKYDDVALPTILIYLAGSLIGNITHATDELSDPFEAADVEALLLRFQALQPVHAGKNSSMSFEKPKNLYDD